MTITATDSRSIASLLADTEPGNMTLELLHTAVDTVDWGGYECIPSSYGMDWISKHLQHFLELLHNNDLSVEEFFRAHLTNRDAAGMLFYDWLLMALGDDRTAFVREVFLAIGAPNSGWLHVALRNGIAKADLAEMILQKVLTAPVGKSGVWGFLRHDFLIYGSGRVRTNGLGYVFLEERTTYWGLLSDEQFFRAVQSIADRMPNELFAQPHVNEFVSTSSKIEGRLGRERTLALLERASTNLTSLDSVSTTEIGKLPMDAQLAVARRLLPQQHYRCQWVVQMARQMGGENGGLALIDEFTGQFAFAGLSDYQAWYLTQAGDPDQPLAEKVGKLIQVSLTQQGWQLGILTEREHRGRRQLQVRVRTDRGVVTYVMERRQHRYEERSSYTSPAVSDIVAFRPETAHELVPGKVRAVIFTLVHRPK